MSPALEFLRFSAWWGTRPILDTVHLSVPPRSLCVILGPSGSGKSTLIRSVVRLNDHLPGWRTAGTIYLNGAGDYRTLTAEELRRRVGIVFQKPVIFPCSIYENAIFGLRHTGRGDKKAYPAMVERVLRATHLWSEVKDRLKHPARTLSLGQQQRLALARTLAVEPELLLLDEPTSSLDPRSTGAVEETLLELKTQYTLLLVTHLLSQAKRVADQVAFLYSDNGIGRLIEQGSVGEMFERPKDPRTEQYLAAFPG